MKNREIYNRVPSSTALKNNGVAKVDLIDEKMFQYELSTFVCTGIYEEGLVQILQNFISSLQEGTEQKGVWVSGFYGSGKSHLVKMLAALWANKKFSNGQTPESIADIPDDLKENLRELRTYGKRFGGTHSAIGTLSSHSSFSVKLAILAIVFKSVGLPEEYNKAAFELFLREKNYYDSVVKYLEEHDASIEEEVDNLMVAKTLYESLIHADPEYFVNMEMTANILVEQFHNVSDVTDDEFIKMFNRCLKYEYAGKVPLTLIAIDELQQYIGRDPDRSMAVQQAVETLCRQTQSKVMFVATGQSAINSTENLKKLEGRFTIQVELSDSDSDKVVRKVVLDKKPEARQEIKNFMEKNIGELSRELRNSTLKFSDEDRDIFVDDYPILPMRRRFWEYALKSLDTSHTDSQIRNQLGLINEAVSKEESLDAEIGNVVPADYIYFASATKILNAHQITTDAYRNIEKWSKCSSDDVLFARAYALIFLIGKIQNNFNDLNLKADVPTVAELLISDISEGTATLQGKLVGLFANHKELIKIGDEYHVQTKVSAEWRSDFDAQRSNYSNNESIIDNERTTLIQSKVKTLLGKVNLQQGDTCTPRNFKIHFGLITPEDRTLECYVWSFDGWGSSISDVKAKSASLGTDSSVLCIYVPKIEEDNLRDAIMNHKAAEAVISARKNQISTTEAQEAYSSMQTTSHQAQLDIDRILNTALQRLSIYVAGKEVLTDGNVDAALKKELNSCVTNLYPRFKEADQIGWDKVYTEAAKGKADALKKISYSGDVENQGVCKEILQFITPGKKGSDINSAYGKPPYGWSKDTTEGAIMVLFACNKIKAEDEYRQPVEPGKLERKQIGKTLFKLESPSISMKERLEIRAIIKKLVPAGADESPKVMSDFINNLKELHAASGGDNPKPVVENSDVIDVLSSCWGNELLKAVYDNKDELIACIDKWTLAQESISQIWPLWKQYTELISYAEGYDDFDDCRTSYNAIINGRLLIDGDTVKTSLKNISQKFAGRLSELRERLATVWTDGENSLSENESWQQLDNYQRDEIRRQVQFTEKMSIENGSTEEILTTLSRHSLAAIQDSITAISAKIGSMISLAAKCLEPETIEVRIAGSVLKTEDDVDEWITTVKTELIDKVKTGHPVIPRM